MSAGIVECVPNFSEGRDRARLEPVLEAIRAVPEATLLGVEMDPDHNRSVVTMAGPRGAMAAAAFAAARAAREAIDLTRHQGGHPRMGAVDVIPFVPVENVTMADCVALARDVGRRIGDELGIPVFLYEDAATTPARQNLADVRRGEFEGLRDAIGRDPARRPDFGPERIHPTAGAVAVGARNFLIAYNVNLATADLDVANRIAKAARHSSGGLRFVKAMGVELKARGIVQVSMNLTDYTRTPIARAFELVRCEAERYGVAVVGSEIVGLVPEAALRDAAEHYLRLERFDREQVIEDRLRAVAREAEHRADVGAFLDRVAARTPAPGGGSVAALAGGLGAALAVMVARLTRGKPKYAEAEPRMQAVEEEGHVLQARLAALIEEDARAFDGVLAAQRLPRGSDLERAARDQAVRAATLDAARVPLETARAAGRALGLLADAARLGNVNAASDAAVGALVAAAAVEGAALNVEVNLATLAGPDDDEVRAMRDELGRLRTGAEAARAEAVAAARARSLPPAS